MPELSITQKGIVLVVVPLLFELAFVWLLSDVSSKAEQEAKRANHLQEVANTTNMMIRDIYNLWANQNVKALAKSGHIEDFTQSQDVLAVRDEVKKLLDLTQDDPEEHTIALSVQSNLSGATSAFEDAVTAYKQNDQERYEALIKVLMKQYFTKLVSADVIDLPRNAGRMHDEAARRESSYRDQIHQYLVAGVSTSVILTVILAIVLTNTVTKRLAILADNTHRLARGELLTPLPGKDEVGEVDRAFREMAEALGESARRERVIFDNARDLICSIDSSGRISAANQAASNLLGYTPRELTGRYYIDLVDKQDTVHVLDSIEKAIKTSESFEFEARMLHKNGHSVDLLWSAHWSEQERALFCVLHDMTERKEAERARQEVVAMVTHDLRTPLTSIRHILEIIQNLGDTGVSADVLKMVGRADVASTRMMLLINDLLDIEKIKSGMMNLQLSRVLTSELFELAAATVSGLLEEKSITLIRQEADFEVLADPDRMSQVLVNLISNAIKFSVTGSQIVLSAEQKNGAVEISIRDTGTGIPVDMLHKIFDRFQQIRDSDSKELGGSGLGLAICKAIVELHGGTVWAESENGKGSTFRIRLNAAPEIKSST